MYRLYLYRKITIYGHFLYNLYTLVWIQHGCLTNRVSALDPNNIVIKRLWCTLNSLERESRQVPI